MKKALLYVMVIVMLLTPLQNMALAGQDQPEAPAAQTVKPVHAPGDAPAAQTAEPVHTPGDAPAELSTVDSASPLLQAVLLAMLNRDAAAFDAGDSELAWECLYNLLSLYGQADARSAYEDYDLLLSSEIVGDYAAALLPDFSSLGALPETLSDRIVYQPERDSYLVVCGENGLSRMELSAPVREGDKIRLTGELVSEVDGRVAAGFRAALASADNMLGFTLVSMELT